TQGIGTVVGLRIHEKSVQDHGNNCLVRGHFLVFHTNDPIKFVCQADFLAYRDYYTLCQGGQGSCYYNQVRRVGSLTKISI
ncbi:MAG: hypothetical protein N2V71_02065, partial [Methanophagales archaeon]|nr:hypothetical protein [Methanophagales archaeon]